MPNHTTSPSRLPRVPPAGTQLNQHMQNIYHEPHAGCYGAGPSAANRAACQCAQLASARTSWQITAAR